MDRELRVTKRLAKAYGWPRGATRRLRLLVELLETLQAIGVRKLIGSVQRHGGRAKCSS
jgi:hypothetical protein